MYFYSAWLTKKVAKRYDRLLGCFGAAWAYSVVAALGSLVVVFLPISVTYVFFMPERSIIMTGGILLMMTALITCFYGILKYAFGGNMLSWIVNVRKFGLLIYVPAMMIAFYVLLIYGWLITESADVGIKVLLGVFIFLMTPAIYGYLKSMWSDYFAGVFEPKEEAVKKEQARQKEKKRSPGGELFR